MRTHSRPIDPGAPAGAAAALGDAAEASPRPADALAALIAHELAESGICVLPDALPEALWKPLRNEAIGLLEEGEFRAARIGVGANARLCPEVRSDRVRWFDPEPVTDAQRAYVAFLEEVRVAVNERTWMGLFDWEGHFAAYLDGAHYRRHLDVFANAPERRVSVITYLNPGWDDADGGTLRVYLGAGDEERHVDVAPTAGTVVVFDSQRIYHEVMQSHAPRFSVTGWFRVRSDRTMLR